MYDKLIAVLNNSSQVDNAPGGNVFLHTDRLSLHFDRNNSMISVREKRSNTLVYRAYPNRVLLDVAGDWKAEVDSLKLRYARHPEELKSVKTELMANLEEVLSAEEEPACEVSSELLLAEALSELREDIDAIVEPETSATEDLTDEQLEALLQEEQDRMTASEPDNTPEQF